MLAWGESNERQRGWYNPRPEGHKKSIPRCDLAASPPDRSGEKWVCTPDLGSRFARSKLAILTPG